MSTQPGESTEQPAQDEATRTALLSLVRLPSTPELERRLETARGALQRKRQTASRVFELDDVSNLELQIESMERELERAGERDRLQAQRPDGCVCLGLGGKEPLGYYSADVQCFAEFCGCPEGLAAKERWQRVVDREEGERRLRRQQELLDDACIPPRFQRLTLDSYPVTTASREAFERIKYVMSGPPGEDVSEEAWDQWHETRRSLLIHGPFGTGKTGLAVALLKDNMAEQNEPGLFATVPMLLDSIRRSYGPEADASDRKFLELVKSIEFLVLDDLGAERVTDWVLERLFVIINHRHDYELTTIFTSNLSPELLGAHIGERTMWRIVEMCEIVHLTGPNLRDRASSSARPGASKPVPSESSVKPATLRSGAAANQPAIAMLASVANGTH